MLIWVSFVKVVGPASRASLLNCCRASRTLSASSVPAFSTARVQASMAMREKVFEAAAALVPEEVPETLVNSEMERRLHDLAHRLEEQGLRMTIPQYLAATGQDQQEFVDGV